MSTAPGPQPAVQDPVKVDPEHYRVELENDRVRVLRITYGPREKSVMHSHPDGIAVFSPINTRDSHFQMAIPREPLHPGPNLVVSGRGAICPRTWPINRLRSSWSS